MDEARTRLAEWITRTNVTQRKAAEILGLDHTFLNQILSGRRVPGLSNAALIERKTGIPAVSWVPTDDGTLVSMECANVRKSRIGKR